MVFSLIRKLSKGDGLAWVYNSREVFDLHAYLSPGSYKIVIVQLGDYIEQL